MSEAPLKTIVCQLYPNHPNGKMNRAGFVFTLSPQFYEVTEEQLQAIIAEPKVKIVEEWKRAFEIGLQTRGFKAGEVPDNRQTSETHISDIRNPEAELGVDVTGQGKNLDPDKIEDPDDTKSTAGDVKKGGKGDEFVFTPTKAPEGKKMEKYNKAELVFALQEVWQVPGKDFQIDAANSLLLQLLQVTATKNPPQ